MMSRVKQIKIPDAAKELIRETLNESPKKEQDVKIVFPNHPDRKEIGFYFWGKEVSWEDIPIGVRMHDYDYYYRDGMEYFPFKPEEFDNIKEQDVNLDKEIIRYKVPFSDNRECLNETTLDAIARHFYELGFNAKADVLKIKGWVARAKDGELALFSCKQERNGNAWDGLFHMKNLNAHLFPNLKWEDEPIEVELIINKV